MRQVLLAHDGFLAATSSNNFALAHEILADAIGTVNRTCRGFGVTGKSLHRDTVFCAVDSDAKERMTWLNGESGFNGGIGDGSRTIGRSFSNQHHVKNAVRRHALRHGY